MLYDREEASFAFQAYANIMQNEHIMHLFIHNFMFSSEHQPQKRIRMQPAYPFVPQNIPGLPPPRDTVRREKPVTS